MEIPTNRCRSTKAGSRGRDTLCLRCPDGGTESRDIGLPAVCQRLLGLNVAKEETAIEPKSDRPRATLNSFRD